MCNRFLEDFVNKVIERNKLWLWIYSEPEADLNFLLIYADSRKDAILKLREHKSLVNLFHPNFDIFTKDIEAYISRFEIELYHDRECNYKLVDLSKADRI